MGLSYLRREGRTAAKRRGSKIGSGAASQAGRLRPLALEAMEGRLMLTHVAPVLDSAGTPAFTSIVENMPLAANIGSTVSDMLASGGAGFLTLDSANGAQDGIAVIGQAGDQHGLWQYSTNGGANWSTLSPTVTGGSALLLRGVDKLRFLPDAGFTGQANLQFLAWDQTDGASAGSQQDLTLWGSHGGSTAYSDNSASATLDVTGVSPASFTLAPSTNTLENNTNTASGGSPGGSNPNVISVAGFASNISIGSGGSGTVSFTVSDVGGNFSTLFPQAPTIDSSGTLTYQLNPDVFGTATFSVTAFNGAVTSAAQQAAITVTEINDPPTLNAISDPAFVLDTAGQQSIALSGITAGLNESQSLTVTPDVIQGYPGDTSGLLSSLWVDYSSPNSTGTLHYTPVQGKNGTAHVTVTVTDDGGTAGGGLNTFTRTFVVTVKSLPSFTPGPNESVLQTSAESFANWATNIAAGYPGTSGNLSFAVTGNTFPGLFSVQPSIDPATGTLSFTPTPGWYGASTITVTLNNNSDGLSSAPHSFTIYVRTPPTTHAETYEVNYTGSIGAAGSSTGLLANDSDPNWGDVVTTPNVTTQPAYGSLSVNSDGSFTYTAGGSFQGVDHFSYQAVDWPAYGNIVTDTVYSHEGALVEKLYQQALGRAAEDAAITYYASRLHNGQMSMYTVANNILTSTDHANFAVNAIYQRYLGRAADPSGLSYFSGIWLANSGQDQVIAALAVTDECYNHAGGNNTAWVTWMYEKILNREPDSGGLNYFVGALNNATMNRSQVVQTLIGTAEYRNVVINGFYTTYLQRSPSSSELSYWAGQLQSGMTQVTIQDNFIGTPEYASIPAATSAGVATRLTSS